MATRELKVNIVGDASSLERALGRATQQTSGFGRAMQKASYVAVGALAGIAVGAKIGFDELARGQEVAAQTGAVLKSTGGIANVTAKQVDELAQSQSHLTGIDDELIQTGENLLLTFKQVRNEVGRGNDIFDRATIAALDLSKAGFGSVESASKTLGKALNDPVRGMTALRRAGVTFSKEQEKAIKALVETGDVLGAQKLILREVESQVGGSAKAWGETLPGQLAKARNAFEEMAGNLTQALVPALTDMARIVSKASAFFAEHQTLAKTLVAVLAGLATTVLAVNAGIKIYAATQTLITAATKAWTAAQFLLNVALTANPIGVVIVALAALVAGLVLAYKHSETFRKIVDAAFKAVKVAAEAVLNFFRDNWKIIATLISGPFAPVVLLATDAFGIRSKLIAAGNAMLDFFKNNWKTIAVLVSGPFAPVAILATDAFGVRSKLLAAFDVIQRGIANKVGEIVGLMRALPGRLLGALGDLSHILYNAGISIIQGLIDGITAKLDALWGLVSGIGKKIASLKGPIEKDRKLLRPQGEAIVEGLIAGMQNRLPDLDRLSSGIGPRIRRMMTQQGAGDLGASTKAFAREAVRSFEQVGQAKDALSGNYDDFTESTQTMAEETGGSFKTLADLIGNIGSVGAQVWATLSRDVRDTNKLTASPLLHITAGLDALSIALNNVRANMYGLRNAARDTIPEIIDMLKQFPKLGDLLHLTGTPGMAGGGSVSAGTGYIVGEAGPELFVPRQSGTILPNGTVGGDTLVVNLNFHGPTVGTSREFEDTVRRALYDVSRRNPGLGFAVG